MDTGKRPFVSRMLSAGDACGRRLRRRHILGCEVFGRKLCCFRELTMGRDSGVGGIEHRSFTSRVMVCTRHFLRECFAAKMRFKF